MLETVRKLASLRGVTEQSIADQTTQNFRRLVGQVPDLPSAN